ncbi:MAG: hypothetical protein AAF617_08550 [Bacteroidota bacterium]
MKRFLILLILCTITLNIIACNEGIHLLSSIKQKVVQGVESAKPYTQYSFEIMRFNDTDIQIDSVIIFNKDRCVKVNHSTYDDKLLGSIMLHASLHEGNYTVLENCKGSSEKVVIHYKVNNRSGKLKVSTFEKETVTRR